MFCSAGETRWSDDISYKCYLFTFLQKVMFACLVLYCSNSVTLNVCASVTHQREPCTLPLTVNSFDTVLISHQICRFLLILYSILQDSQLSGKQPGHWFHCFHKSWVFLIVRVSFLKLHGTIQPVSRLWKGAILSNSWIASRHIALIRQLALNCTASALENNKLVWKMPLCIFHVFDTVLRFTSYYLRAGKRSATCFPILP